MMKVAERIPTRRWLPVVGFWLGMSCDNHCVLPATTISDDGSLLGEVTLNTVVCVALHVKQNICL